MNWITCCGLNLLCLLKLKTSSLSAVWEMTRKLINSKVNKECVILEHFDTDAL
jgi:hypothetical protein